MWGTFATAAVVLATLIAVLFSLSVRAWVETTGRPLAHGLSRVLLVLIALLVTLFVVLVIARFESLG